MHHLVLISNLPNSNYALFKISYENKVIRGKADLVQYVLAGPPQDDGASLGVLALYQVGEVLITYLTDLKQATPSADVRLLHLISAAAYGTTTRPEGRLQVITLLLES